MNAPPDIQLPHFHMCNVRVTWRENYQRPGWTALIEAEVTDIETGERGPIVSYVHVPPDAPESHATRMVAQSLRSMLLHELEECLFVDGVRLTDPHKGDRSAQTEAQPLRLTEPPVYKVVRSGSAYHDPYACDGPWRRFGS